MAKNRLTESEADVEVTATIDGKQVHATGKVPKSQLERAVNEIRGSAQKSGSAKPGLQSKLFDMQKALGETLEPDARLERLTPEQRRIQAKGLMLEAREELASCFRTMKELSLPSEAELERLICAVARCYAIVSRTGLAPQRHDEKAAEKAEKGAAKAEVGR